MFRTGNSGWLAIALVAATCLLTASVGWAQTQPYDTFQVNYFSNANNGVGTDAWTRIINTGADAPSYPPSNLCAMIYVFDNKQELKECCGCLISTDGLAELSLRTKTWSPILLMDAHQPTETSRLFPLPRTTSLEEFHATQPAVASAPMASTSLTSCPR